MGLDTYASRSPDDLVLLTGDNQAFEEAQIELCGGIFSGEGCSFRGKVYSTLIFEITGESLYQEWIPPEKVKEMYLALASCDPEEAIADSDSLDLIPDEIIELRKFFKVCADRELGLINWW